MTTFPEQVHLARQVTIRRERLLPVPGDVPVQLSQAVSPDDVVAWTAVAPRHYMLDVDRRLGLSPAEADRLVTCRAGQTVRADQILARRRGLFPRIVRAPAEGRVIAVGGGQILLQSPGERLVLRAGLTGTVVNLTPELGVTVEGRGALLQAAWGNGRQGHGIMRVLGEGPEAALTSDRLDVSHRGTVACCGTCADAASLKLAGDLQLRGLILGTLAGGLREQAEALPFPVILTDGWGNRPMSTAAFDLLQANADHEVALDATPPDRRRGSRPEIVMVENSELGGRAPLPTEAAELAEQQRVRVVAGPNAGAVGMIVGIDSRSRLVPSGTRAVCARVDLDAGGSEWVPAANLEIVE